MIIPSIDLMGGQAVQLVGGKEMAIEAGDPRPIAERFRLAGEIAVIDLDAALGQGDNRALIEELVTLAPCRVGGGIRDVEAAIRWLDAGASKVILGTAAKPEILSQLPRERVTAALDAVEGEVVTHGWTTKTGASVKDRMAELRDLVGGFLVTFVEREGRMQGTDLDATRRLKDAAGSAELTVAGGFTTANDIRLADQAGADAQVGMALYSGALHLADAIAAPLKSDRPDGLWPTVVCDEHGRALGLAYSDRESLTAAVDRGVGAYHSRRRGLWVKGETSGATQDLLKIDLDCDRDALRFTVRQSGDGFCHLDTWTCWGEDDGLPALARLIAERRASAPEGSYTRRLFDEAGLLDAKLLEEAQELVEAESCDDVAHEAADVIYFALAAAARAGVSLSDIERELVRRSRKVTRRKGDAKPSA
ncbi:MAG: phosphoribosyl-ATP diphosphatase [Rhodospirillaceae bacterium]|nr:phosphoribosyl-ATP diphosphatase [Rhodospirillaceae bacterium]|tara:strand:+ start:15599 stop:16861 length:1263 start_codon:yes stop_codon:yes gene_type:complete